MFKITDKIRARYLLEVRERGGHKFWHFVRTNKLRYFAIIIILGGLSAGMALTGDWYTCFIGVAYILGVLISDLSWLRGMKMSWPFMSRALNWDEVEKVYDE